jgi:hypothetical protein
MRYDENVTNEVKSEANMIISRVRGSNIEVQCFIKEDHENIANLQARTEYLDSSVCFLESDSGIITRMMFFLKK